MSSVMSKLSIGRGKTKPREPGKIEVGNFGKFRDKLSFRRQSNSKNQDDDPPPRVVIKTTPVESRPDDHDLHSGTPIANEFSKPRKSQEFPIQGTPDGQARQHPGAGMNNGVRQHQNTTVLQAQGPTAHNHTSDSSAPLSTSGYQPMFQKPSDIYRNPKVSNAEITPSPDPDGERNTATELPNNVARAELPAVSPLSEPVEAPTSPMKKSKTRNPFQDPAELSSAPRPQHANIASQGNGAVPQPGPNHNGRSGSRQYRPYSPDAQHEVNSSVSMAVQGARGAYNPKPSVPQPARADGRAAPRLNPVQADQGSLNIDFSHHESDEEATQEPRQQRTFPLFPRKRDSQDNRPNLLQKPNPQPTSIDDDDFSDQRHSDDFLKSHNGPRNQQFDRLGTLLVGMETKLREEKEEDLALVEHANALDVYEQGNAELQREIASMQTSENARAKLQKQQRQLLEQANATIETLHLDLQAETQAVKTLQDALKDITIERDQEKNEREQAEYQKNQAETSCGRLLEEKQELQRQWVNFHGNEMDRVRKEYAGQMDTLRDQMEQKRVAFRDQINQDRILFQTKIDALLREHKHEIELKEAEIREMIASHESSILSLQSTHKHDLDAQEKILRELRRRMASYNNTGGYTAISDDDFRNRFQKLTRGINNLIKLVPRPQTYAIDEHLDPNGFLARNAQQGGRNWPKFVRSVCWRSILRGFYSRQLGFGAFGNSGEGFEELDQLRQLFTVLDPLDPNGMRVTLPNTKELNTWRASFFDALAKTIRHGTTGQGDNKYIRLFHTNMEAVTQDIVSSLQQVANTRLDPRIWDEVASFVEGLGTLALEMGSQRAHVYIETCEHGESITVGDRFRDDADLGYETLQVDLMTQPCLTRVGDGREDLQTARTIVKGDFVALKQQY